MKKLLFAILACSLFTVLAAPSHSAAAEVVLYSSNPSELIDMVSKGFEGKTGIKVSVVRLGTGEAMKRIGSGDFGPASAYAAILIVSVLIPLFILHRFLGKDLASSL
jgi:ABC-type tungstate transport system permease subunit